MAGRPRGYRPFEATPTVPGLWGGDVACAYPLSSSSAHEVVDDLGGPVLVTHRPVCRSGTVTERVVDDAPTRSDASGLLWTPLRVRTVAAEDGRVFSDGEAGVADDGNLVCDDRTAPTGRRRLHRGIYGPKTGERLSMRPSMVTAWADRRDRRPDAEVPLPPPASGVVDPPI